MNKLRVIVGCEYSQIVMTAFLKKGHDAYSCDIIPTEGDYPERHFQEDILEVLKREKFDLGIFHPPCTYLANAGVQYLHKDFSRWGKMYKAELFFIKLLNSNIEKICVENPVPHRYTIIRHYDQIVYPYWFGEKKSKRTCLWLKNLPLLKPENIVEKGEFYKCGNKGTNPKWYSTSAKNRSRTFEGIANAMSRQWNF